MPTYFDTAHTATHCNTLQHTATHCNTLQHLHTLTARIDLVRVSETHCNPRATHCNTLQHIHVFPMWIELEGVFETHRNTLATHSNTQQHTAIQCHRLHIIPTLMTRMELDKVSEVADEQNPTICTQHTHTYTHTHMYILQTHIYVYFFSYSGKLAADRRHIESSQDACNNFEFVGYFPKLAPNHRPLLDKRHVIKNHNILGCAFLCAFQGMPRVFCFHILAL